MSPSPCESSCLQQSRQNFSVHTVIEGGRAIENNLRKPINDVKLFYYTAHVSIVLSVPVCSVLSAPTGHHIQAYKGRGPQLRKQISRCSHASTAGTRNDGRDVGLHLRRFLRKQAGGIIGEMGPACCAAPLDCADLQRLVLLGVHGRHSPVQVGDRDQEPLDADGALPACVFASFLFVVPGLSCKGTQFSCPARTRTLGGTKSMQGP